MPIKVDCSSCGHSFNAPSKYMGKKVKCPKCKDPQMITANTKSKSSTESNKSAKAATVSIQCKCGQKFGAKAEWAGKKIKCPGCGEPVRIPGKSGAVAKKKSGVPAKRAESTDAGPTLDGLFDEIGYNTEDGSAHRKCPECRSPMAEDAVICIDCGYNENTGKKMETYRPVTAEDRAKQASIHDTPVDMKSAGGTNRVPSEVKTINSLLYVLAVVPLLLLSATWATLNAGSAPPGLAADAVEAIKGQVMLGLVLTLVLNTIPALAAAYLLNNGKPLGRIIAMIVGGLSLISFPIGTIIGFFILRNAMSDAAKNHCS